MSRVIGRALLGVLALFALGYAAFQVWRTFNSDYETQPAMDYVLSETITAKGIAIREEVLIEGNASENLSYVYKDGAHVSRGTSVASIVNSQTDITNQMRRDEIEQELSVLESLSVKGDSVVLQTDTLAQRVYADIDTIVSGAVVGDLSAAQEVKYEILSQLNRRSIATESDTTALAESLENRIAALEKELSLYKTDEELQEEEAEEETLQEDTDQSADEKEESGAEKTGETESTEEEGRGEASEPGAFEAPEAGYFTKHVDGLESILTPETMDTFSVSEFVEYINSPIEEETGQAGKIVTSHVWYFAVVLRADQAEKLQEGRRVELDFGLAQTKPFTAIVDRVIPEKGGARCIVVLQCENMNEELVNLRVHKVDISLTEMSGYKLPISCKYYQGEQLGVYVLETTVVRFKPVEIIYEDEANGYVVLNPYYQVDGVGLERFDEVIIGGRGLEDGKVVQR